MRRTTLSCAALLALLFMGDLGALAADEAAPIPGLPWVHEGTIVTCRNYVAQLAKSPVTFKLDKDGTLTGSDGRNYTEIQHGTTDAGGLMQTTVLGIDGDDIALKTTRYTAALGDPIRTPPDHNGEPRFLSKSRQNTFCEDPALLAQETTDLEHGKYVRQVVWQFANHPVDAIRIDKLGKNEWTMIVYDRKLGIGLHLINVSAAGEGESILSQYDLLGYRDPIIPWAKEAIPQAVKNMKSMRLAGQVVMERPQAPRPTSVAVDYSLDHLADKWASFKTVGSAQLPGMAHPVSGAPELRYYSSHEFGGLWIGPAAVVNLKQGQVLDEDQNTHVKTSVSKMDDKSISITQANASTSVEWTYDRATGLLLGSEWFDAMTKFRSTFRCENAQ